MTTILRWASALGLVALAWAASAEARTTVATNVTNGSGVGQNPFDKASQRKVVRDAAGTCYVVFTQTRCYGAGCPGTPTYQNREVVIARSLDCDTSWQQFLLFSSAVAGTEYLYPSIDLSDDRQTLHVVAYSTTPSGVLYTQNASPSGTGWSTADSWKRAGGIDPTPGAAAIASPGAPVTTPLDFTLAGVDASSPLGARLVVNLQGGSESGHAADHHLEVRLNSSPVGETSFSGQRPHRLDVAVPVSSLIEGANTLSLVNLADTGVTSRVFLDRFSLSYPQLPALRSGVLEGTWAEPGIAEVAGNASIVLDTTLVGTADPSSPDAPAAPRDDRGDVTGSSPVKWLIGAESTGSSLRFRAEPGHRYFVVSREGLLHPRVSRPAPSALRDSTNQADFILVATRDFMAAAQPLLDRRQGQGLTTAAVSFEEIAETFGHGQPSPEAIRDFLSFAFHSWARPSSRYVLLLGDSTFDPRRFQASSWASPLPALWTTTSYLTTASDPALVSVNGTDLLPDLAIGRLPAQTPAEAETLVAKILAWEDSSQSLDHDAVLVADNPDEAGDFEADVEDIRATFLASRPTQVLKLRELGPALRPAVKDAFDEGASLMSYVGHGGAALWASENVWNSWGVPSLLAQSRQPPSALSWWGRRGGDRSRAARA